MRLAAAPVRSSALTRSYDFCFLRLAPPISRADSNHETIERLRCGAAIAQEQILLESVRRSLPPWGAASRHSADASTLGPPGRTVHHSVRKRSKAGRVPLLVRSRWIYSNNSSTPIIEQTTCRCRATQVSLRNTLLTLFLTLAPRPQRTLVRREQVEISSSRLAGHSDSRFCLLFSAA